jgi:hypothetical protein
MPPDTQAPERYIVIGGNWFALCDRYIVCGPVLAGGRPDFLVYAEIEPNSHTRQWLDAITQLLVKLEDVPFNSASAR